MHLTACKLDILLVFVRILINLSRCKYNSLNCHNAQSRYPSQIPPLYFYLPLEKTSKSLSQQRRGESKDRTGRLTGNGLNSPPLPALYQHSPQAKPRAKWHSYPWLLNPNSKSTGLPSCLSHFFVWLRKVRKTCRMPSTVLNPEEEYSDCN